MRHLIIKGIVSTRRIPLTLPSSSLLYQIARDSGNPELYKENPDTIQLRNELILTAGFLLNPDSQKSILSRRIKAMGATQSVDGAGSILNPEELSTHLAERFATKCFTPLELTHFKDNFFSRALDQGGLRYWNEKILSDFLGIPDGVHCHSEEQTKPHQDLETTLDAGPVIFRMVSYLGAFPFQRSLAPSVLTFEAMVKVVVLLTDRYGKVLRRGRRDRIKLLFGSLADVGRINRTPGDKEVLRPVPISPTLDRSHTPGFSVDDPANDNDDDDDDDDDLALAALEALDAIEVFRQDQRIDRAVYEARISVNTFRRLLYLLLILAPLGPLESVPKFTFNIADDQMAAVRQETDMIIAAFSPEEITNGIPYKSFAKIISVSLPYVFDALTPLFEHFLFSKNLDLSRKHSDSQGAALYAETGLDISAPEFRPLFPVILEGSFESAILNPTLVSRLSFFLAGPSNVNLYRGGIHLHPVFSTTAHGESFTSFSHNVLTWQAPTILLIQGASTGERDSKESSVTIGAYLPQPWKPTSSSTENDFNPNDRSMLPCIFQLDPFHAVLPGNPSPPAPKPTTPLVHFSNTHGIAVGYEIPPSTRTNYGFGVHTSYHVRDGVSLSPTLRKSGSGGGGGSGLTPLGAGSLLVDHGLETAQLHISYTTQNSHSGHFLAPVPPTLPVTRHIDIWNLEIWGLIQDQAGCNDSTGNGSNISDPIIRQRDSWRFDAQESERRRNINLHVAGGGNADTMAQVESARALLEMAGLVGDRSQHSGGSV